MEIFWKYVLEDISKFKPEKSLKENKFHTYI
jgi:hypothetical protein